MSNLTSDFFEPPITISHHWELRRVNIKDGFSQLGVFIHAMLDFASPIRDLVSDTHAVMWFRLHSSVIYALDYLLANTDLAVLLLLIIITRLPKVSGVLLAGQFVVLASILHLFTNTMSV